MGNSIKTCGCTSRSVVQVTQTNGYAQQFRIRATVAHVMEQNPDHLVVRCSRRKRDGEKEKGQSRIMILNPEHKLIAGQTYLLYPIPQQYIKNPCQNPFLSSDDKPCEDKERRRSIRKLEAAIELEKPKLMSFQWKPSLDSIPESPPYFTRKVSMTSPQLHVRPFHHTRLSAPSTPASAVAPQNSRALQISTKKQTKRRFRVHLHPRPRCFVRLNSAESKRCRSPKR